jgi:hypothetical protein
VTVFGVKTLVVLTVLTKLGDVDVNLTVVVVNGVSILVEVMTLLTPKDVVVILTIEVVVALLTSARPASSMQGPETQPLPQ